MSLERSVCLNENLSERFTNIKEKVKKQYAHIYTARSKVLSVRVKETAMKKWNINEDMFVKLSKVTPGKKCCLIGTLFKQMELQPNILKEVNDEFKFDLHETELTNFIGDNDQLILEDSCQRITLVGSIDSNLLYTGVVIAVLGEEGTEAGKFVVDKFTYADLPPQIEMKVKCESDQYLMFISGLSIGKENENPLAIQLLLDFINAYVGGEDDQDLASQLVHIIVCGNSISSDALDKSSQSQARYLTHKSEAKSVSAMNDFDFFMSQILPLISVDIMPGEFDLSSHILPQKPLHPCLFPSSRKYLGTTLKLVSNPYQCKVNGINILGTSGQNINNMASFSKHSANIDILLDTLRCQHISPTAPDTLGCFPFIEKDPFIIDQCPHIYYCGNQEKLDYKTVEGSDGQNVLLLCVPDFSKTSSVVMVNLKNYQIKEIKFNCGLEMDK